MCPFLRRLTIVLLLLPVVFVVAGVAGPHALLLAALVLLLTYGWIWSRFRPTTFVVHPDSLEVFWPLKRVRIPRDGLRHAIARREAEEHRARREDRGQKTHERCSYHNDLLLERRSPAP